MQFPIVTERLTLRPVEAGDLDALVARRSDPEVAALQNWTLPYSRTQGQDLIAGLPDQPQSDQWFMLTLVERETAEVLGDLALHPTWDGRCVEIGYTLGRQAWGRGFAVEAVAALVDALWADPKVTRVHAMTHPDNLASVQVLERTGFQFEGHTRLSYWVGDDNSDDVLYGMTRPMHLDWTQRPASRAETVEFVEITAENERIVSKLKTHKSQEQFVSPVVHSFVDALFPEVVDGAAVVPWFRAIRADGEYVGFVMLAEPTAAHPEPYLWRLLIDRRHQRRRVGTRSLDLIVEQCRSWGAAALLVSWVPGRGSPEPLYLRYGFVPTGEIDDGETVARLDL